MGKPILIPLNGGIQFPPKLGTLILKKTASGKLAYAQNVDSANDEYGQGAITPGPALVTIGGNSELTGVPFAKTFVGVSGGGIGYLWFLQGLLGAKTIIRRVKDLISGSVPVIDTAGSMTVNHGPDHANQVLVDILLRVTSGQSFEVYVSGKDDTDTWVYKFVGDSGSPSLAAVATNANFTSGLTDQFMVLGSNNIIYWIGRRRVSSISTADVYVTDALANGLPLGSFASAGTDWNELLAVAVCYDAYGGFDRRLSAGRAEVILWDRVSPNFNKRIPAPCRYISVLKPDPEGNLIAFGGINEGKASIYEVTSYGMRHLYSYIGDLPRSHHSVEFDGQGRILFVTADGQHCRFDRSSGQFDHLGTIATASSAGGLLARALGSPLGNEFLMASGSGSTYTMKRVAYGSFVGDGGGSDGVTTPLAVSGIEEMPYNSTISKLTMRLTRPLQTGEKVVLRAYINGSTTPKDVLTMDYSVDGAKVSKEATKIGLTKINNISFAAAWKMADASATAPAVLPIEAEID